MKKIIKTIFLIVIASNCFSQIPNFSFEDWTSMGSYVNPAGWGTMNNTTASALVYTATKGTPGNPGAAYLKLTSKMVNTNVVNGIAVCGVLDTIAQLPKTGYSFSLRPQRFIGKWQHMIYGSSQGSVSVLLTKWNSLNGSRDTVAVANHILSGMVMSWGNFSIDFTYQSGEYPDTCFIVLKASGAVPAANDYLWVDSLAFSGSVAGVFENAEQMVSVDPFPNPANNDIQFNFPKLQNKGDRIIISDILGNIVFVKPMNESEIILNTTNLPNGTYFFRFISNINERYASGKFTIQH